MKEVINRWIARRAYNALVRFMNTNTLTNSQYNHGVAMLDILCSKIYTDWKE